jgi:hypothetical protein
MNDKPNGKSRLNNRKSFLLVALSFLPFANPAQADLSYTFKSGTDVAVTASSYTASGPLNLTLDFEPKPGTSLTVIKNTGLALIGGRFDGVPQGQAISLSYKGKIYKYIANYYGRNGRSFVFQWPNIGVAAWGLNQDGQLGNNHTTNSSVPVAVKINGALAGKTVIAVAAGSSSYHSMALASDGQVFAWGRNSWGQLGDKSRKESSVPVAVNTSVPRRN